MFVSLLTLASSARWAVLFTGSKSFYNYRHQADSFYLFNMLQKNGIPRENTIFLCYNDVVSSPSNPFKGQVFRGLDHVNVYPGLDAFDYTGSKVTAENYFKVLRGDSSAGPALKSTREDDVYLFFEDHGGDGILGVPEGCGPYIYADQLASALRDLFANGLAKRVFYAITACYAGSVAKLADDIKNLYIMTASNDHESAYACLYDPAVGTYLSSEFTYVSHAFYEKNPDATLGQAFVSIKNDVSESHVSKYGDMTLESARLSDFIGKSNSNSDSIQLPDTRIFASETVGILSQLQLGRDSQKASLLKTLEEKASNNIDQLISGLRNIFPVNVVDGPCQKMNWDAYRAVLGHIQSKFSYLGESFYAKTHFFSNLCSQVPADEIIHAINMVTA